MNRYRFLSSAFAVALVALVVGVALGQAEISIEKAKEILYDFLTRGEIDIGLSEEDFFADIGEPVLRDDELLGRCLQFHGCVSGFFEVCAEDGTVIEASRYVPMLKIETRDPGGREFSREDIENSAKELATISLDEAQVLARDYVAIRYRDFEGRNFKVVRKELSIFGRLVSYDIEWREQPRDEEVAVFPNRIFVSINPRTAEVLTFVCTDIPISVKQGPKVEKERALDLSNDEIEKDFDEDSGYKLANEPEPKLVVIPKKSKEDAVLAWKTYYRLEGKIIVDRWVILDANTGEVISVFGR